MADPSTPIPHINQLVQIGRQRKMGSPVPCTRRMASLMIDLVPVVETKKYRGMGYKNTTVVSATKKFSTAKISGPQTFEEIIIVLSNAFATKTNHDYQTAPDSPVMQWIFTQSVNSADLVYPLTVERGTVERAGRAQDGRVTDVNLNSSREENAVGGSLTAGIYVDDVTISQNETQLLELFGGSSGSTFTLVLGGKDPTGGDEHSFEGIPYNVAIDGPEGLQALLDAYYTGTFSAGKKVFVGGNVYNGQHGGSNQLTFTFGGESGDDGFADSPMKLITFTHTGSGSQTGTVTRRNVGHDPISEMPLVPIEPSDWTVYLGDTFADEDLTEFPDCFSVNDAITKIAEAYYTMQKTNRSFKGMVEAEGRENVIEIACMADDRGMQLYAALQDGTTKALKLVNESNLFINDGIVPFKLELYATIKVTAVKGFSDNQGIQAGEFTAEIVYDPTVPGAGVGVKATKDITLSDSPNNNENFIVGGKTYRFRDTIAAINDVLIDDTAAHTAVNLKNAITHGTGEGTKYYTGTTANALITASGTTATITLTAILDGEAGNAITLFTTSDTITWDAPDHLEGGENTAIWPNSPFIFYVFNDVATIE